MSPNPEGHKLTICRSCCGGAYNAEGQRDSPDGLPVQGMDGVSTSNKKRGISVTDLHCGETQGGLQGKAQHPVVLCGRIHRTQILPWQPQCRSSQCVGGLRPTRPRTPSAERVVLDSAMWTRHLSGTNDQIHLFPNDDLMMWRC